MRTSLVLIFFLSACGSDSFTGTDAAVEGGADGKAPCTHDLCDDFDFPNEVPANIPPWSGQSGTISFGPGNNSARSLEAKSMGFGSYARWFLRSGAKGLSCSAQVWLEPSMDRDRSLSTVEVDVSSDGGSGTFFFSVFVNDMKGTGGSVLGPGTLANWGGSTTVPPKQQWLPFKFDAIANGVSVMLAAQVGPATITGSVPLPVMPGPIRFDLGSAGGMGEVVRWDNVTCDAK